ncbi:beta-galactosidase [Paenibacillus sp. strain BS8-2]
MNLGVAYYPEHHRADEWPADYEKIRSAGIKRIRIAEFAWAAMEPREAEYQWDWLDESITLAAEFGLEVVLCTPTACPPVWLAERYPDILPVHHSGHTVGFGARQHRSYHSPNYLAHSDRIVLAMARRYGSHPNVVAWQLDNEFGGETKFDYGDCSRQAFHAYLAARYGSIDALNDKWGTMFWSQRYERYDQIPLPAPIQSDVMMWHHPSLELEFANFSSEGIVAYARRQAKLLREFIGDRPITTNAFMFRWGDSVDWSELFSELDVVGMDIYSDKPHEIAFYCDACRGVKERSFWMMEYGTSSPKLGDEMADIASRGCESFYLFKLKPFPWGQEQGRGQAELLTITGEPSPAYQEVQRYAEQSANVGEAAPSSETAPAGDNGTKTKDRVALYYDFTSSWSYRVAVADRRKYADYVVDEVYQALYKSDVEVNVIFRADQLTDHKAVILPLHVIHDKGLEARLIDYVKDGGIVIATEDLFRKDEANVFLTEPPSIFSEVFGLEGNNFVSDIVKESGTVMASVQHDGGGEAFLVKRESDLAQWSELLQKVLK